MKHFVLLLLAVVLPLSACDTTDDEAMSVTATVIADTQLSTLEAAVIEANLDDALADEGATYTVFAPTDAAFAALLEELDATAAQLLARADLGAILQLHVVSGSELFADDLSVGDTVTTLNGETLTVVSVGTNGLGLDTEDDDTEANATIVTTDIGASNGVVHKINAVLLPSDS